MPVAQQNPRSRSPLDDDTPLVRAIFGNRPAQPCESGVRMELFPTERTTGFIQPGRGSPNTKSHLRRTEMMSFVPSPGACAVMYQPDKEAHILKVKPSPGSRFSLKWLNSVTAFAIKQQKQTVSQRRQSVTMASQDQSRPAVAIPIKAIREDIAKPNPIDTTYGSTSGSCSSSGAVAPSLDQQHSDSSSVLSTFANSPGVEAQPPESPDPANETSTLLKLKELRLNHDGFSAAKASCSDFKAASPQPPAAGAPTAPLLTDSVAAAAVPSPPPSAAADPPRSSAASDPATPTPTAASLQPSLPAAAAAAPPLQLSIRLEGQGLTDREAEMFASWAEEHSASGLLHVRKLWMFDNKLGDSGAVALAGLFRRGLLEAHLSHNSIGAEGMSALLAAIPATAAALKERNKGLWLRIEWNQIPEAALTAALEKEHQSRGLVSNVMKTTGKASRGHQSSLQLTGGPAHVRLPWVHCQRLAPSAAPLLREARNAWRRQPAPADTKVPAAARISDAQHGKGPPDEAVPVVNTKSSQGKRVSQPEAADGSGTAEEGPLLVFPDTSALLQMLSDRNRGAFTMKALQELAERQRFGRSLPPSQQVFIVLADSVLKQLDGLKSDSSHCVAIRAFLSTRLDACGPAGLDFLTVLGAHEGEGVIVAADAEVAGSRSNLMADKGQAIDAKIVEVALFFQAELLAAAHGSVQPQPESTTGVPRHMPVLLLSSDNAQLHLARSHGLPAAKVSDLTALPSALQNGGSLTAHLLRGLLRSAATAGLGTRAGRSLQTQFDQAVACLRAVHSQLVIAEAALAGGDGITNPTSMEKPCEQPSMIPLSEAVVGKLEEWESLVASHQSASRVLQWSVPLN